MYSSVKDGSRATLPASISRWVLIISPAISADRYGSRRRLRMVSRCRASATTGLPLTIWMASASAA